MLPSRLKRGLRRRAYPDALTDCMRSSPLREVVRLLAPRVGLGPLVRHDSGPFSTDAVCHSLDREVSERLRAQPFLGVYAYEDAAEYSFREATRRGMVTLYDLPIGYWRAARTLLEEEAGLQPDWAATLNGNSYHPGKTARKDAELDLADVVFVASSFTRQTLDTASRFKGTVVLVPYGAPAPPASVLNIERPSSEKLRVLFVGALGQRKGLSYLFEACNALKGAVELTVIGQKPAAECRALDRELSTVRWLPNCPHQQVLAEMARHDVLVFPALFEGFGLVLLEAMAMGLPVITTPHTAGPDLIDDGVHGFIVPIRSTQAIVERLEILRRDAGRRADMAYRARLRARDFTWQKYGDTLAACVARALGHS
ncbi:MAG TPA: glycosyltransferase family 4 protein [Opitutaceae bacterium]